MFELDPRLATDSVLIKELPLSQCRLANDSRYPWLILVPKIANVTEVHELTESQQIQLIKESSIVAKALKKLTGCNKVNVANLGNVVSQLHWHIVARNSNDEAWPGPIWGVGEAVPWNQEHKANFIDSMLKELNQNLTA